MRKCIISDVATECVEYRLNGRIVCVYPRALFNKALAAAIKVLRGNRDFHN